MGQGVVSVKPGETKLQWRYVWDVVRWRPLAVWRIGLWWLRGAPMQDWMHDGGAGRWDHTKLAYRAYQRSIMWRYERTWTSDEVKAMLAKAEQGSFGVVDRQGKRPSGTGVRKHD